MSQRLSNNIYMIPGSRITRKTLAGIFSADDGFQPDNVIFISFVTISWRPLEKNVYLSHKSCSVARLLNFSRDN